MHYDNWGKWQFQKCSACGLPAKPKIGDVIYREPDVILDPMAGTGTVMMAALMGRPTICIDIEPGYHAIQHEVYHHLQVNHRDMSPVFLIQGNCKLILPIPCNHIIFCLHPDTPVLMYDLTWKSISNIKIGDELLATDEFNDGQTRRKLRKSIVEDIGTTTETPYVITLEDGRELIASAKHAWLGHSINNSRYQWITTDKLTTDTILKGITGIPWRTLDSYDAGYLAGLLDGEGSISSQYCGIGFKQKPGEILWRFEMMLEDMGIKPSVDYYNDIGAVSFCGLDDVLRLVGSVRPKRLLPIVQQHITKRAAGVGTNMRVVDIDQSRIPIELIGLKTSTSTLIANGIVSHNSPPYGQAFKPSKKITEIVESKYRVSQEEFQVYAETTGNVGKHNTFLYSQDMEKVYKLCFQSIAPGGTLSVVTKDIIEGGKRTFFTKWILRVCKQIGFVHEDWFKTEMYGGPWQDIRRSKGEQTVDDEDTLVFRRP